MNVTLDTYHSILDGFQKAEKKKEYLQLLNLSLESIAYISNYQNLNMVYRKLSGQLLTYACKYLAILQEESELYTVIEISKRYSLDDIVPDNIFSIFDTTREIYDFLQNNPGSKIEDIYNSPGNSAELVEEIVNLAEQLGVISDKGKGGYYLTALYPDLKGIMAL